MKKQEQNIVIKNDEGQYLRGLMFTSGRLFRKNYEPVFVTNKTCLGSSEAMLFIKYTIKAGVNISVTYEKPVIVEEVKITDGEANTEVHSVHQA